MTIIQSKIDFIFANSRFAVQNDGTYLARITTETCSPMSWILRLRLFEVLNNVVTLGSVGSPNLTWGERKVKSKVFILICKYLNFFKCKPQFGLKCFPITWNFVTKCHMWERGGRQSYSFLDLSQLNLDLWHSSKTNSSKYWIFCYLFRTPHKRAFYWLSLTFFDNNFAVRVHSNSL